MDLALQITSLVLSLTALLVTGAGFYASLMFYREGRDLNAKAQDALARIDEKANIIHEQIGKRFEMTLSSVLSGATSEHIDTPAKVSPSEQHNEPNESSSASEQSDDAIDKRLSQSMIRYFNLRGMRLSDVSNPDNRSLYEMGQTNGFYLFDGDDKIVFFGPFMDVEDEDVLLNIRGVLNNIDIAYQAIKENATTELMSTALEAMDKIEVEALLENESDIDRVRDKCEEFKSEIRSVPIRLITLSEFEEHLDVLKAEAVG